MLCDFVIRKEQKTTRKTVPAEVVKIDGIETEMVTISPRSEYLSIDEIAPITLTTEILERNGFEVEEVKGQKYYKYCAYYLYPDYNGGFRLGRWHTKIGFVSPLPTFRYVHELQQGLRMVGYTNFANSIKV